ncbi:MAG: molecular chaperone DnaK [Deltaproteobacteria bacterium]|nr:molecular chaperone DnaK [Deltaproteobacteria bacterium]MBW2417379.1 molecular chaperone DnaK [Deltaproteobacteria bacterium]
MSRVIGIDLGTTNSCVAVVDNGQPAVVPNTGGYKTTPSMFAISQDGKRLVGHLAKRQAITNSKDTVFAAKRLIGRRFDSAEVQKSIDLCPYEIVRGPNDDPRIKIGGKTFTCPEISGIILREMKRVAEEYLGEPVQEAVITVPAYFNDTQRQCTKDSGKIAGLEVLRIINEPTAAALAYGMARQADEKIAVYDLGGGTFDISILEMSDGVVEVLATAGNTFLGGEDFDRRIVAHLVKWFQESEGIDLRSDTMALQRLKDAAEKAKCDLSIRESTEINLPFIASDSQGPRHLNYELTRETLEALVDDIVRGTLKSVEQCSQDAGLAPADIDQIVLVGGQTRMPLVQNAVAEYFGKRPHKGVNPDEVVALGAAIQGASLMEEDQNVLLLDVTPLSLGIGTYGGHFARLIDRNTTVPVSKAHIFTTTRDDQSAVKIRVLQGESETAVENDLLGEFVLSGIRPAPKGEPEVEVSFDIDANGIVSASARDLATGKEQSITVNATGTLSDDEITQIIEENELYEVQLKD